MFHSFRGFYGGEPKTLPRGGLFGLGESQDLFFESLDVVGLEYNSTSVLFVVELSAPKLPGIGKGGFVPGLSVFEEVKEVADVPRVSVGVVIYAGPRD